MKPDKYIRYRIYLQTAEKADQDYPRRIIKNLHNLHNNIKDDITFWERQLDNENIKHKVFIPKNLNHVNPIYHNIISHISEYFNCYAVWEKTMIKGSIKPINTFRVFGYEQDMLLTFHYLGRIINNLDDMRFNLRKEYRRIRINQRRRGENISEKENASVKASNFLYTSLLDISKVTKQILENKPTYLKCAYKTKQVENYIRHFKFISFRAYHYGGEPNLSNAFSREGKFQNKRIIR